MTLKEAKKILKNEGYFLVKVSKGFEFSELPVWEKPEVVEAKRVVNKNGFATAMNTSEWIDRQERLKKEYGKNHIKGDFSWKNSIIPGSPALKESASQFNDALLDEQAKKIAELTKEKSSLKAQITVLNACKKHNDKIDRKQIKCLGKEIARLNGIIHDKNAILSDVAEELRLTKIREKNLAELGLKYVGENEKLKEQLADKVVDKIDVQALKSAESALAYKEKVIARKDMALAYYKKKIAEKDEVIADLTHELKAKHKKYVWYKGAYDAAQQILNTIADYAAKHPDKKFSDQMVGIDNAEEGGDQSATIVQCGNGITISKEEAEIIERCTKNSTELHYSKKDGFTYTNVFGEEMPIRCLRGMFYAFTDEEIENMKK